MVAPGAAFAMRVARSFDGRGVGGMTGGAVGGGVALGAGDAGVDVGVGLEVGVGVEVGVAVGEDVTAAVGCWFGVGVAEERVFPFPQRLSMTTTRIRTTTPAPIARRRGLNGRAGICGGGGGLSISGVFGSSLGGGEGGFGGMGPEGARLVAPQCGHAGRFTGS